MPGNASPLLRRCPRLLAAGCEGGPGVKLDNVVSRVSLFWHGRPPVTSQNQFPETHIKCFADH